MKKKLIFVAEALWVGGIESSLVNLLCQLDYDRFDVTCLIVRDYQDMAGRIPPQCRLLVADRDRAVSFPETYRHRRLFYLTREPKNASGARRLAWKVIRFLLRGREQSLYASYIRHQMDGESFDVCVIYSDRTAEIAVKAVKAERYCMYYHHGAMRRELHDECGYRKSEKVIAVSEPLAQKLREFRPRYAEKIVSAGNLVNCKNVREMSLEQTDGFVPRAGVMIATVGRIAYEKGMDLAVRACRRLVDGGIEDLRWYIVGEGPEMPALQKQVSSLGLEDHITLVGMRKNPYPFIRNADLYVQPSRVESFGLTIMEAAVLAKPIVSTGTDGARGIITDGVNGTLCDADAESVAKAVRELLDRPELAERYRTYWAKHDFEADNKKTMDAFYRVAAGD